MDRIFIEADKKMKEIVLSAVKENKNRLSFYKHTIILKDGELYWDNGFFEDEKFSRHDIGIVANHIEQKKVEELIKNKKLEVTTDLFKDIDFSKGYDLASSYPSGCETETNLILMLKKCIKKNNINLIHKTKLNLQWMIDCGLLKSIKKGEYTFDLEGLALLYRYFIQQGAKNLYQVQKDKVS